MHVEGDTDLFLLFEEFFSIFLFLGGFFGFGEEFVINGLNMIGHDGTIMTCTW